MRFLTLISVPFELTKVPCPMSPSTLLLSLSGLLRTPWLSASNGEHGTRTPLTSHSILPSPSPKPIGLEDSPHKGPGF